MESKIARYLEIKASIEALERERKTLAEDFRQALEAETPLFYMVNGVSYKLSRVSRVVHSCEWKRFFETFPEVYSQVVSDKESTYPEVRKASRK